MGKRKTAEEKEAALRQRAADKLAAAEQRATEKAAKVAEKAKEKETKGTAVTVSEDQGWLASPDAFWLSVDCATVAGYALWQGSVLMECGTIQPRTKSAHAPWDRWDRICQRSTGALKFSFPKESSAWESLTYMMTSPQGELVGAEEAIKYVCYEHVFFGKNVKTASDLDRRRGRVDVYLSVADGDAKAFEVPVSRWRRVVTDTLGVVWPEGDKPTKKDAGIKRAMLKAKAIETVTQNWGITVTDDAAEAVLLGYYFIKTHMAGQSGKGVA